jgi:hypothetical protein
MKAEFIKFGDGLFYLIQGSFLASSISWARCASKAFSFSRTFINDSSPRFELRSHIGYSEFLGQCLDNLGSAPEIWLRPHVVLTMDCARW